MNAPDPRSQPTLVEAIIPVAALILLVAASFYLFGDAGAKGPNQVALITATIVATFIAWRRGFSLDELREAAIASITPGLGAIFILFAVGALIGAWAMSGTLVAIVYYGLKILSPTYFYATAVLICAIASASIGSSWTTVGTIGVGLMGIAASMELSPAITAAAVISGSYFGDTTSPLSDSANLVSAVAEADLYQHLRETLIVSAGSLAIALAVFWSLGSPGTFDSTAKLAAIERAFNVSPVLFLPLVLVIGLALFRFPPFTAIFLGALAGGLLGILVAPERVIAFANGEGLPGWLALIKGAWLALAGGYTSTTGFAPVDELASRGGMSSMLNTVWLIITALAFGGVVEKAGMLDRLIGPIVRAARTVGALVASLVAAAVTTNVVTADQYMSIVLPARMFKKAFATRGFAPVVLSRAVGLAATPSSALVPWNSCGAYMAATLGVATFSYAPYAVFNIVSPVLAILLAYAHFRIPRPPEGAMAPASTGPEPVRSPRD